MSNVRSIVSAALFALSLGGAVSALPSSAPAEDWATYFERSGGKATPRYDETIDYCRRLAAASKWIEYTSFGTSPQGRDLPLLIIDKDGGFTPRKPREKAVLLVQACIHAGESDGKDAGLMLARDIAITKKLEHLVDGVTVLFIPIFNVDGHEHFGPFNRINQNGPEEMGWRVTAQNLNLNRDYLKADAPEMRAWLRLFNAWLPDFFIDCHVTDGADYRYVVTYALETRGNMASNLTAWTRDVYQERIEKMMADDGFPLSPYIFFRKRHDPESGLVSWVAGPRFSQGYTAIRNRPGLLIETHMLKDYKTRVTGTYHMLANTLAILNDTGARLMAEVARADAFTASARFRSEPFPVRFKPAPDSTMIDFLGVDYEKVKSDLTGGFWFRFGKKPVTYRIPYFNRWEPAVTVELPEAYIIPPEWTEVIERLGIHGVRFNRLKRPAELTVASYRFENMSWRSMPYEGRFPLKYEVEPITERRVYPAGSVVVDMAQKAARVVAHLLEPQAPDALVYWGFFDTIFEQKEYAEDYVMEKKAREMLAEDEGLRGEFDRWRTQGTRSPRAILNWFYEHTPYWDGRIDVYPVGRITDRSLLEKLETVE